MVYIYLLETPEPGERTLLTEGIKKVRLGMRVTFPFKPVLVTGVC